MKIAALVAASALGLAACASAPSASSSASASKSAGPAFKACMVSDSGGFDDKSFNQAGYDGLKRAVTQLGVTEAHAESAADTDYAPNIDNMIQQKCDLTITVGFLLADATKAAAAANPTKHFAIIDNQFFDASFKPLTIANIKPLLFNTAEAAFLAGYLAAGVTTTGTVATFGGMQIGPVTIFMDGFVDGVAKYNTDNGKTVKVLGWDKAAQTGVFTGDFNDQSKGQNTAKSFIDAGADIILPVAGPVGLGAAAAAKDAGNVKIIGVDQDWFVTAPQYKAIILSSVLKQMEPAVFDVIKVTRDGGFDATVYKGDLANNGVGLAPYHDLDSAVPAALKAKIDSLKADIIAGTLKVTSPSAP
jgi:basic membrane protein A